MAQGMNSRDNVGPGWQPILDELEAKLDALVPGYEVFQIKEKFAGLRYYVDFPDGATDEAVDLARKAIYEAEEQSLKVCEDCGEPGTPRTRRYWIRTRCDSCFEADATLTQGGGT